MTQPTIPPGWKLVPVEPTEAMVDRFVSRALCVSVYGEGGWSNYARSQWAAMLAGAPAPPRPPEQPTIAGEREAVARIIALHGLGTFDGRDHRGPPNASWTQPEWERRILECVPEEVERQCYALADAILARPSVRDGEVEQLQDALDDAQDALAKIVQWADAYPLDIFPEPDFAVCASVLKAAGQTLDAVSASNMRHVVEGVGNIARAALSASDGKEGVSDVETEMQWEVWQGDDWQAGSDSEAEGRHYLAMYGQDGPARLVKAVTTRTTVASLPTTTETGA